MSTNSTINEVFYELANARPCWIVYVTLRTKSMNNSANKLLAIYSFFEIVHQSGHFLFAYLVFSGQYLMPYKMALQILTPSLFAAFCTNFLLFFTSIDRLIAVIFPLRESENVFFYVITLPFIGLYCVYALYSQPCDSADETVITGTMNDIGMTSFQCTNSSDFIWPTIINLVLLTTIVLYVVIAIVIYFKKSPLNSNSHQFNIRIFRSLFCIVSVNISGYFVIAASNAPILYFTSTEYRKAFDKEWQTITKLFNRNSNGALQNQ
uniref:G-protein coupled receptors family 1 profile domain-containing protein n=1 Tax=Globodera rostochiensis TaxID=31243 RepID=A0A914HFF8_GLORO